MILNDLFYYFYIIAIFLFMSIFMAFFVRFIYSELGGVKIGKDSFLFFDYIFFGSGWKSNLPALAMIPVLVFGDLFDFIRGCNIENLRVNVIGFFFMIFLFIHCRFFSNIKYDEGDIKLIKEFFI